jgi:hypothetical protein
MSTEINYQTNEHGVVQYPKGDTRRMFVLLAAIDELPAPNLKNLENYIGSNRSTILSDIEKVQTQLGVKIGRHNYNYFIIDWGETLKKAGVKKHLKSWINQLIIEKNDPSQEDQNGK